VLQAIAAKSSDPSDILKAKQLQVQLEQLEAQTDLVAKKFNDLFSDAFANALSDMATGAKSVKEAFLDMTKSITKSIADLAAKDLASQLFGKGGFLSGAGDFFSKIFSKDNAGLGVGDFLSKIFGGKTAGAGVAADATSAAATASAAAASTAAAAALTGSGAALTAASATIDVSGVTLSTAGVSLTGAAAALTAAAAALTAASVGSAANGAASGFGGLLSGLFDNGTGLGPFLGAGQGYANGTNFARGGMTLVGERGPEIVNLPRGAQVVPNDMLMQKGNDRTINLTQYITMQAGVSTASARQAAAGYRDAISRSARDR
jgi:hypothetical protein